MTELVDEVQQEGWRLREKMRLLRRVVKSTIDESFQGEEWEREASEMPPEPTPESVPPMQEPTEEWEQARLAGLRAEMRRNWPSSPRPLVRRKLPIR